MGFLALVLIGGALWLLLSGKLARLTGKDGMMLGLAIVGAVMAARGKPLLGGVPLGIAALYALRRLLGVSMTATADDIRAAHRRLIAKIHPDAGGTQALAEKINDARSILLQHLSDTGI